MHTRRIFTEVCQLRVHSVIKAIGDTIHTICGECRGILRSVCRCWGYIALCRLSLPPAASPHVHKHWKALYLGWNAAQGTILKLLNLASAVERVWQQCGGGREQVYRGSRNTEQRRWRLKKVSIKKAPAVRTEQAAASELTSEPWAQSAGLSHCLFVPPEPPPVLLFAPSFACFFGGGEINESTYAILNSRDSFSSIKKNLFSLFIIFPHFTPRILPGQQPLPPYDLCPEILAINITNLILRIDENPPYFIFWLTGITCSRLKYWIKSKHNHIYCLKECI